MSLNDIVANLKEDKSATTSNEILDSSAFQKPVLSPESTKELLNAHFNIDSNSDQSKHIRANVCFYEDSLQWNGTTYEPTYTCFISTTSIIDPNTRIMSWLEGKHRDGKSFDDVEAISFKNTSVHYFPLDLDKFFPNLRIVKIENCGLKSITRSDLNGLENIDTLFCPGNRITSLPNNLFTGMYKLRSVVFRRNRIKIMSSKVFTPIIKNLIRLDLTENVSIDAGSSCSEFKNAKKFVSKNQLMKMIDNQCQKPTYESREIPSGLNEIWTTGRYSDITLITDTKKFKAHKVILAANSPVFDTIFNNHMKDRSSDEVYLKNIKESVVKTFLDFLYTGKIEENGDQNLGELFSIASKFKVAKLTSIVEKLITINLNDENALEFLKLGCLFNCDKMKVSTFNVLKSMFDFPLKEDLMNQPEAIEKLIEAKQNFDSSLK